MTITDRVRNILKASVEARNSDIELQVIYMQKSGMNLSPLQIEKFRNMDDLWTVRRIRQKLQEKGFYEAEQPVKEERKAKAAVIQQVEPRFTPEQLEKTLGIKVLPWGKG